MKVIIAHDTILCPYCSKRLVTADLPNLNFTGEVAQMADCDNIRTECESCKRQFWLKAKYIAIVHYDVEIIPEKDRNNG